MSFSALEFGSNFSIFFYGGQHNCEIQDSGSSVFLFDDLDSLSASEDPLVSFFLLRNVSQELDLDGLSLPDSECFFDVPSQLRYDFEFLGLVVGGAAESDRSSFSDNLGDIRPRPTEGFELD